MRIAIIPARGGSKRIPRKNVKEFREKPMIAWSIDAALKSECFDEVIVSTDDDEIAQVAKNYGALVPFMRPADLADDHTGTIPVLRHAVEAMEEYKGEIVTEACCLYATAPFVTSEILKEGMKVLRSDAKLDFAFSVTSFPFPVQRALTITPSGQVDMLYPEYEQTRSQDLPECYHDAGQFYWFRRNGLFQNNGIFTAHSAPVILPRERVQDIDTEEDWRTAELAHKLLQASHL